MNSFTSAAAASLLNHIYGQGILQDTASLWFLTLHSFWQVWPTESCNTGHWPQCHLCPSKPPEILPRAEAAGHWKDVQSRINLIGMLQLPAVQGFAKILKYLQTNLKKKFLLETCTSQTTRTKISMSLYCKLFVSAERFNLHSNAASRLGVYGEGVP